MSNSISWSRFLIVVVLLALALAFLDLRQKREIIPAHLELYTFPAQVGLRMGRDIPLTPDVLEVLGPGEFLLRDYLSSTGASPVNLFIAYFSSQRTGDTIHSPKNCMPGTGWAPLSNVRIPLSRPDGSKIAINRYVIAKGTDRDIVFYWYQAHGHVTPSEYWSKIFLVKDAIELNRTDGALVRVVVPVSGSDEQSAQVQGLEFVRQIQPLLDSYIPR